MRTTHLAAACVCASLTASCGQSPKSPSTDIPRIEAMDDDGDFGGDPDIGGSVGGDPGTSSSIGGDPTYAWSPPAGVQGGADVGDSEPDPSTNTGDDSSPYPVLSANPSPNPQGRPDTVSCYKFEYGADCLQRCKERHHLNVCHASQKHPTDSHAGRGLLSGCSWTNMTTFPTGYPIACSYYYPSNSDSCTFYTPLGHFSCEWSP